MTTNRIQSLLLFTFLTLAAQFSFAAPTCGEFFAPDKANHSSLVLDGVQKKDWKLYALKEIKGPGEFVGMENGVYRGRIHNQNYGEDCWAQTMSLYLESWYFKTTGKHIRISPERLLANFLYDQFHRHLGTIGRLIEERRTATPARKREITLILNKAYGRKALKYSVDDAFQEKEAFINRLLYHPDDGNSEWNAIQQVEKWGVVPEVRVQGTINSARKEEGLETALYRLWDKLILEAQKSSRPSEVIAKYYKTDKDGFNEELFKFMKSGLRRYLAAGAFVAPSQKISYRNGEYTAKEFYKAFFLDKGFDLHRGLVAVQPTAATIDPAMRAMAIGILTSELPVPIGMTLAGDKILSDSKSDLTVLDFVNQTGLFTTSICPGGNCVEANGGHEISVVNFIARKKDGSEVKYGRDLPEPEKSQAKSQLIKAILNGDAEITKLIIQNSWGDIHGVDVNGDLPSKDHGAGFYVVTAETLRQTSITMKQPFDFAIPAEVLQHPEFQALMIQSQGRDKMKRISELMTHQLPREDAVEAGN